MNQGSFRNNWGKFRANLDKIKQDPRTKLVLVVMVLMFWLVPPIAKRCPSLYNALIHCVYFRQNIFHIFDKTYKIIVDAICHERHSVTEVATPFKKHLIVFSCAEFVHYFVSTIYSTLEQILS